MSETILFGAGAIGRSTLRHLRSQGIDPVAFADNDPKKQRLQIDGVSILEPSVAAARFPQATWLASVVRHPFGCELRAQIEQMGVRHKNLWECLSAFPGIPGLREKMTVRLLAGDQQSQEFYDDQIQFRRVLDCDRQLLPCDIGDIYFPGFITQHREEHFVDCGAADGDTVRAFLERWPYYRYITALEPDTENHAKMAAFGEQCISVNTEKLAVADHDSWERFAANGDCSSHLDSHGIEMVKCSRLDALDFPVPPTYIKMDIEGAELEALWGARKILRLHSPVLAICAYHAADHLWQIPLLIHALQPRYELFLRRYAEGASELVWYAVPPERVVS